jgi:hypothetical protein
MTPGYWPVSIELILVLACSCTVSLVLSVLNTFRMGLVLGRFLSWSHVIGSVLLIHLRFLDQPAGLRMLALCLALLLAMKAVVLLEMAHSTTQKPKLWLLFGFFALWPGMNPEIFVKREAEAIDGWSRLMVAGVIRVALGLSAIFASWYAWQMTSSLVLLTILLLPGLSLTVHFGLFNILAGAWQRLGIPCQALFIAPLISTSLNEFWSKRWNLAYSEMVRLGVYLPLSKGLGNRTGLLASFVFSGLLHEVAISFSVNAGYGLPMLYFVIHGALTTVEKKLYRSGRAIDNNRRLGWAWMFFWVAVPAPILFHIPFLQGAAWPIVK